MISPSLAEKIDVIFDKMKSQRSTAWNLDLNRWDWSSGVGLWGVVKCHETLNEPRMWAFLDRWRRRNAKRRVTGSVNNVMPANVPLYLWRKAAGADCRAICDEYADWCMHHARRTSNGGLAHVWEGGDEDYRHQLWVDTVFMAGLFMVRYGLDAPNQTLLDEGLRQVELHLDTLFEPKERLFRHAYHCGRKRLLGEHWGRGNGWMVASLADILAWLPRSHPRRRKLADRFTTVMERAFELRGRGGRLRTLLHVPEAYLETTCSGLFGYAALRGHAAGVLDRRFQSWGIEIVTTLGTLIGADGSIAECSYGTNPESRDVYLSRPFDQSLYADGIALMALAEAVRVSTGGPALAEVKVLA